MIDEPAGHKTPKLLNRDLLPSIIYSTVRRDCKKPPQVLSALQAGYCAVNTASSRRFHDEKEDGKALAEASMCQAVPREGILV